MQVPSPPLLADPYESERWGHTRLRRRLLDGTWRQDLIDRVVKQLGPLRAVAQGGIDMSANPFRVTNRELSTLYMSPGMVRHNEAAAAEPMIAEGGALDRSGWWAQQRRYQTWAIGCREYLTRAHATEAGELRYRPVPPDLVLASSDMGTPDVPNAVSEARLRKHPVKNELVWTWDRFDISNPDEPVFEIREFVHGPSPYGKDWTDKYGPTGWPDLLKNAEGMPVLPYVVHHAERIGDRLWDPWEQFELLEGSLTLAVLMSFWLHVVQDASWPQRWVLGAAPVGLTTRGDDEESGARRQEIITDPATLLALEPIMEGIQAQVGQFQPGGDPETLLRAIDSYAARLMQDAGMSGSDVLKVSADPRSGYAIALSNDGKREAQRRYTSSFRDADQRLMGLSAILLNRAADMNLPEDGYSVVYSEIPLSADERRGREESVLRRLDAGLLKRSSAYVELNPGLSDEQAQQDLAAIDAERAARAAMVAPQRASSAPNTDPDAAADDAAGEDDQPTT